LPANNNTEWRPERGIVCLAASLPEDQVVRKIFCVPPLMPPLGDALSSTEIDDLVSYLMSLRSEP